MTWVKTVGEAEAEGYVKAVYEGMVKQRGWVPKGGTKGRVKRGGKGRILGGSQRGSRPNARDRAGMTALKHAARTGRRDIAELPRRYGAAE